MPRPPYFRSSRSSTSPDLASLFLVIQYCHSRHPPTRQSLLQRKSIQQRNCHQYYLPYYLLNFLKNLSPRRKVRYEPRGSRTLSRDLLATKTNDEVESDVNMPVIEMFWHNYLFLNQGILFLIENKNVHITQKINSSLH